MFAKRSLMLLLATTILTSLIFSFFHLSPLSNLLPIQQKPEQAPQKVYDYYVIVDEADDHTLMSVPLVVNVGDELLSEDNKFYIVVKTEENRAYARFVGYANLEKYKSKNP